MLRRSCGLARVCRLLQIHRGDHLCLHLGIAAFGPGGLYRLGVLACYLGVQVCTPFPPALLYDGALSGNSKPQMSGLCPSRKGTVTGAVFH